MSTITTTTAATPSEATSRPSAPARVWRYVEERLTALTERANPILVKETRQALKSRQFVATFLIVLAACWIASFAGVAVIGPRIYYAAAGPQMLLAYYAILCFPLAVIVPYSAFRSLAGEQEDNTYDLLSITTLGSRQIISGKLWSAIVQMLVYLSAVSPCIAFTFLLRGVDALSTALLLTIAVLSSLGLSMTGLLVGASSRVKQTQIVISVALVLGLFWAFGGLIGLAVEVTESGVPRDAGFWAVMFGLATLYVSTFGLLHAAASAQIAFASENRSTPLRWWMMAQQGCLVGWVAGAAYAFSGDGGNLDILFGVLAAGVIAAIYWYVMGALMTAEWPHLSRRVQRTLPQSSLARTFLSFFVPGPGAGYLFAVANLTAILLAALGAWFAVDYTSPPGMPISLDRIVYALVLSWAYVVGYLGLGRLVINALRRWMYVPMTAGFLLHIVILLAGVGVPMTIQVSSQQLRNSGYTLLQMSNPVWTLAELLDHGASAVQAETLILIIPASAAAMLLLNMRSVAAELRRHRIAAPERVVEEEAALHPAPRPGPSNPWDVDDDEAIA
jgi:hypothetical protein